MNTPALDSPTKTPLSQSPPVLAVSVATAARMIACSRSTCYALVEQNVLPHIKLTPKRIIIPLAQLRSWLDARAQGGKPDE